MKTLTRNLLIGSLAVAVTLCVAGLTQAADQKIVVTKIAPLVHPLPVVKKIAPLVIMPNGKGGNQGTPDTGKGKGKGDKNWPDKGKGWPDKGKGGHWPKHPQPWPDYRPYPRPIIAPPVYYEEDASNPAPLVEIQLVNPAENGVALRYRLDNGQLQSLPAGYSVTLRRTAIITFDRGGAAGRARYQLTDGMYKFVPAGGLWELVHQSAQYEQSSGYPSEELNPVPVN